MLALSWSETEIHMEGDRSATPGGPHLKISDRQEQWMETEREATLS